MLDDLFFAAVVLVILLLAFSGYARAKREGRADEWHESVRRRGGPPPPPPNVGT